MTMHPDMKTWIDSVEAKLDAHGLSLAEVKAITTEIEQKALRKPGPGYGDSAPTLGKQFIEAKAADLAGFGQGGRGRVQFEAKTTITTATGSGGDLVAHGRDMAVAMPKRRLTIRNLLSVVNVSVGTIDYPKQTGRPSAADMVAEGATKPESALAFTLTSTGMRVIAHWIPASRQVLEDTPQLMELIDGELTYGLALKEESQLLYGDGTGQNLNGLVPQATAYVAPITVPSPTMIDKIGLSILQQSLTDNPADGVVVHPSDWWAMRLLKDTQGRYLLGDPGVAAPPSLFGLPTVATQAIVSNHFLTGGFGLQTLYDRWAARIEVSTEHADFFTRNLVAILAEERIGLAVKQPGALVYGVYV